MTAIPPWAFFRRNAISFASVSVNFLVMILMLSVFSFIVHLAFGGCQKPSLSNDHILSRPLSRSIKFGDLRSGTDKTTIAVNHQEVTVGKADGTGALADDNVHPVVIGPDLSDLHTAQVHRLTKSVDYLFPDEAR